MIKKKKKKKKIDINFRLEIEMLFDRRYLLDGIKSVQNGLYDRALIFHRNMDGTSSCPFLWDCICKSFHVIPWGETWRDLDRGSFSMIFFLPIH